ncbi:MAG: glycosyltransferase family 2 protein [Cyanobacteria bacterium CRU_2_1]|nr:glycosyltransferase family 2 protein [Cyanobacteria bacterium CRU_2_1]
MEPALSIIICAHNPRRDYLDKVLSALKHQILSFEQWELLLVDNASDQILASEVDLTWHPQSRHIREDQLGLTPARLRGIKEALAETLIFVDDDTVLDADYLEVSLQISKDFPFLGAWGGQIRPEFEVTPPEWTKPYWQYLAIREFDRDKWSNLIHQYETTPCGAGMCVRRTVAEKYANLTSCDPKRLGLGRKGQKLFSGEDSDLALIACDIGLGTGQFVALNLTHLIPAKRLDEAYILKLLEGMAYSHTILKSLRSDIPTLPKFSWRGKFWEQYRLLKMNPRERRLHKAYNQGRINAIQEILDSQAN